MREILFFLAGLVVGAILVLVVPFFRKWVCGTSESEDEGDIEEQTVEKRMPGVRQSLASHEPGSQKRMSVEVPEPPMILHMMGDPTYTDEMEPEITRRTTDSEMDKMCESASVDENNADQMQSTGDDSEAVFEDWKVQLDDICNTLHSLEKSVKGRKAKKRFKDCVLDLEEVRSHVSKESDLVGQMKNFLLNIQDDEGVEEDEREVAKWLTTSFMNSGEGNTWAEPFMARATDRDLSKLALSPTISASSAGPSPQAAPKLFQRFNSDRLRSVSSISSINLQGDHTRDEDEKTLEANTDAPYTQFCFYYTQSGVLKVLENLGTWEFDIFEVEDMVGNLMLPLLGVTICKKLKSHKLNKFHDLPEKDVFEYLLAISHSYHPRSEVSYHNALHAADVMCSSYSLTLSDKFENFNYLQIVALIMAAAAHDVDHDGHNNAFHINSGSKLALKYNDRSVLENHHCSVGWKLAMQPKHNMIKAMPREQRNTFRNIFISSILATDMTGHGEQLKLLSELHGTENITTPADQIRLLGHVLHSADISNVSKPFEYANVWVKLVMNEFFQQGDKEKDLNLPVSPLCDRQKTDVDASEVGFIKFVVKPWFESMSQVLPVRCTCSLNYLNDNYRTFKDRALRNQEMKHSGRESITRRSVLLSAADLPLFKADNNQRASRSLRSSLSGSPNTVNEG